MFGENAGKQSAAMTLFSICWTKVRRISLWKSFDLDYVLHKGDAIFKSINVNRTLNIEDLPEKVSVENSCFNIRVIKQVDGQRPLDGNIAVSINSFIDIELLASDNIDGVIVFANELCVAIFKNKCSFFVFNSHSCDACGKLVENCIGKSILIELSDIKDVSEYIFATYDFSFYELAYIEVKAPENTAHLEKSLEKFKKTKLYREHLDNSKRKKIEESVKKSQKRHYEKFSDDIKNKRAKYYAEHSNDIQEKHKKYKADHSDDIKKNNEKYYTNHSNAIKKNNQKYKQDHSENITKSNRKYKEEHSDNIKKSNQKYKEGHSDDIKKRKKEYYRKIKNNKKHLAKINSDREKRILNFLRSIKEGPFYICVCCHRCLYKRTVLLFKEEKYLKDGFHMDFDLIPSYDRNDYYVIGFNFHRFSILVLKTICFWW